MINEELLFIDFETTGLNPSVCSPIEVAAVITTKELDVVDVFHSVMQPFLGCKWDPIAKEMHEKTGLYDVVTAASVFPVSVDAGLSEFIRDNASGLIKPAGRSVHFDVSFLSEHMPASRALVHGHRVFDVSTLRTIRDVEEFEFRGTPHRALSDVLNDIRWVKEWLRHE